MKMKLTLSIMVSFGALEALANMMPHYDVVDVVADPSSMCGFRASEQDRALIRKIAEEEAREDATAQGRVDEEPQSNPVINIKTYFHIIVESNADKYALTNETMMRQLEVLNEDYASAGFSFSLGAITRTVNQLWVREAQVVEMRQALHAGSWRDLNIYFLPVFPLFGICSLPRQPSDMDPDRLAMDGCIVRADTVPGGPLPNFNMGKTAVHEVGHWLGLFHVFEGGCDGDGDFVDDTPAQKKATGGCPSSQDSCPLKPGLDSIHNYMDYSHDWCYEEFTKGQVLRMHSIWHKLRAHD